MIDFCANRWQDQIFCWSMVALLVYAMGWPEAWVVLLWLIL